MNALYAAFLSDISSIPRNRIYTDELRCLTWGTDAGFYRLTPKIVVRAANEAEVAMLLQCASRHKIPVTFRAAGTSLSGQSISDSVLIVAGKNWEEYTIGPDALTISLQPGIIGSRVDDILRPYGRIFPPDPASKKAAMVGGIVANNASGMNCGIHANSDRMLLSARLVFADGTILDTGDEQSRREFSQSHAQLLRDITTLRDEIRNNSKLEERIRYKYSIKNVTGLNLLPFVTFDDPFDIICHLMVGSEGTLAFISQVTMQTGHLFPLSASAMLYFSDIAEACRTVVALRRDSPVASCELLDKHSLKAVGDTTGDGLTALLIEVKADTEAELQQKIDSTMAVLSGFKTFVPARFSTDPAECARWWNLRSGVFPAVGGTRPIGTTTLIEDIAFHIKDLPDATAALLKILDDCGYGDACIYGHALEGNYHFIISQKFDTEADRERYTRLMLEIKHLVVTRFNGSLKAEHGTGRNMAPFVEMEWGSSVWHIMHRVKDIFDPDNLLNPGVIFNNDPNCFITDTKVLTPVDPAVDRCIECGFCEPNCVSCGLTLSARQRIVAVREIQRLRDTDPHSPMIARLQKQLRYPGIDTCAGDGLCSTSCPMGINTGELVHHLREQISPRGSAGWRTGKLAADHLAGVSSMLRGALSCAAAARAVIGPNGVNVVGRALHKVGLPLWSAALPGANRFKPRTSGEAARKVVYFPSCINRTMGCTPGKDTDEPLTEVMLRLLKRAGFQVIYPDDIKQLCCGMIWESKGMPDIAETKIRQLDDRLWEASEHGRWPVLCDQSPCLHRMRLNITRMHLYEPAEFIMTHLAQHLTFRPVDTPVAVHVTCSTRLMGLADTIVALARKCSTNVTVPEGVGCCGFAGDKGFTHPELNRWALRKLKPALRNAGVIQGYSNSRTCEIGLTLNGGVPYRSIVYLVEQVTRP